MTDAAHDPAPHDPAPHDPAAHDSAAHDSAAHDPAAHDSAAHDRSTARRPRLIWVTLSVALVVIILDQVTKAWALAVLQPRIASGEGPIEVAGQWFRLTFVENTGAGFGIGAGFTWLFAIIAAVVAVVIVRMASRLSSRAWAVALGGLLGGAVGNLIDRLTRPPGFGEEYAGPGQGYVVDFLQLPNWPVFNVADMAIVGSAILMVILTIRGVEMSAKPSVSADV